MDLARLCRTSRVLHYMTLPQLYNNITLTSHHHYRHHEHTRSHGPTQGRSRKRKLDDRDGGGEPVQCRTGPSSFATGLNTLVTRNVSQLVRGMRLDGHWRGEENEDEEYTGGGYVSDETILLDVAVRAAIDRCTNIEAFR